MAKSSGGGASGSGGRGRRGSGGGVSNVNIGTDPARVQQGKPAFFVNWQENGKQQYAFFQQRWVAENVANRLKNGS